MFFTIHLSLGLRPVNLPVSTENVSPYSAFITTPSSFFFSLRGPGAARVKGRRGRAPHGERRQGPRRGQRARVLFAAGEVQHVLTAVFELRLAAPRRELPHPPGAVERASGIVTQSPNLGWTDYPLKERIEALSDWPVFLDNDANCATFGEWWLGAGRAACPISTG